jgi:GMP synthase (glutamine-hydrolysing)
MKKVLILQMRPENETADSEFKAILRVGKIDINQVHRIRVEQHEKVEIDISNYCAIIAGGSPFDVTCPAHEKSDVQKRIESFFSDLFDQIIAIDFPFLGACSGNGLLGSYCGTAISSKYSEPVGSVTVSLTPEGEKDDLLLGLPKQFNAFVGHKEACDSVPHGAVLLVTSKPCPVQMFRIKKNIYATQFHPEADVEEFKLRINIYKNFGYFPPEQADELISALKNVEAPDTKEILRRFVHKYKHNSMNK